mgnify:CR=1 FL=1
MRKHMPVVVEIENLVKDYEVGFARKRKVRALDALSLTVNQGEIFGFLGANGAGKTTLVKLLAKLYEPSAGSILVDNTPLDRIPADEWRTRLAGAFQDFFRFEFRARQQFAARGARRGPQRRRPGRGRAPV